MKIKRSKPPSSCYKNLIKSKLIPEIELMGYELANIKIDITKSKTGNLAEMARDRKRILDNFAKVHSEIFDSIHEYAISWILWRSAISIYFVTGVAPEEILGKCQTRKVSELRSLCFWIAFKFDIASNNALAKISGTDHSTIIYRIDRVNILLSRPDSNVSIILNDILCSEELFIDI